MALPILIVDDDLGTRISLSHYLEMLGYAVVAAKDGAEALELVEQHHPHLLITDIAMPELDGFELVRRVRQHPPLRLLPVIFLTAHRSTQDRIQGYQLGCDVYLPKPFELDEVGAVVRNLMERSQLIQAEWRFRTQAMQAQPTAALGSNQPTGLPPASTTAGMAENLTQREQEVLNLLTEGLSNQQIGDALHLSHRTIEKYVSSLLRKTDTVNRAELVHFAVKHQLVL